MARQRLGLRQSSAAFRIAPPVRKRQRTGAVQNLAELFRTLALDSAVVHSRCAPPAEAVKSDFGEPVEAAYHANNGIQSRQFMTQLFCQHVSKGRNACEMLTRKVLHLQVGRRLAPPPGEIWCRAFLVLREKQSHTVRISSRHVCSRNPLERGQAPLVTFVGGRCGRRRRSPCAIRGGCAYKFLAIPQNELGLFAQRRVRTAGIRCSPLRKLRCCRARPGQARRRIPAVDR